MLYIEIQKKAAGKSRLERRPVYVFTTIVVGWRIKKPARAAMIKNAEADDQFPPANNPINRGLSKKTHEP